MLTWLNETVLYAIAGALQPVLDFFIDGGSRFYWVYCATGLAIAAYAHHKHKEAKSFQETLLDKNVWLSASAINDYIIVVMTPVLRLTVLSALAINWKAGFGVDRFDAAFRWRSGHGDGQHRDWPWHCADADLVHCR